MKYIAALTCLFLTAVAVPAYAVPANDCAARSEKVKLTERDEFMKSCLEQAGSPAKIKEAKEKHKSARCEQNAKNMKLEGSEKGQYQADCVNKNEAVVAANALPSNTKDLSQEPASIDKPKTAASHKAEAKKPAAKKNKRQKKAAKNDKQAAPAPAAI